MPELLRSFGMGDSRREILAIQLHGVISKLPIFRLTAIDSLGESSIGFPADTGITVLVLAPGQRPRLSARCQRSGVDRARQALAFDRRLAFLHDQVPEPTSPHRPVIHI
jgi:hypothetical protein